MTNVQDAPGGWRVLTQPGSFHMLLIRSQQVAGLPVLLYSVFEQPDPSQQWRKICHAPKYVDLHGCTRFIDRLDTIRAGFLFAQRVMLSYTTAAVVIPLLFWSGLSKRLFAITSPSPTVLHILDVIIFIFGCHTFNTAFYWKYATEALTTSAPIGDGLSAEMSESLRMIATWSSMVFFYSAFSTSLFIVDFVQLYYRRWHERSGERS